jgi:hypothetical protein
LRSAAGSARRPQDQAGLLARAEFYSACRKSTGACSGGIGWAGRRRVRCRTRNVRPCAACSTELQKGVPHAVIGCSRVNITHLVDTYGPLE